MKSLNQDIVLTHFDHHRLQGVLRVFRERSFVNQWNLDALELGLTRARTVPADTIPCDVVTMNSKVALRNLTTGERSSLILVFPEALTHDPERVSVLSALGLSLLGSRVGDMLEHCGPEPLLIERIDFQPEAKGNYFM
ncbi:MAG TPA: GreA/GreB family elongation factor [Polyangiales bacterium]|nr:GreA/GreB family elongation factor [Polyangiales bacterium]